jgi:hypothetical protein|tara:strand:- start:761 stop:901 length:141 start_codon:yes stop_codon:yes gene_type:complete
MLQFYEAMTLYYQYSQIGFEACFAARKAKKAEEGITPLRPFLSAVY